MTLFSERWLRRNARRRFGKIRSHVVGESLLDVGAAEGWIGECARDELGISVDLVDVVDLNRTLLVHHRYDGLNLPFPDKSRDTVALLLVLHHCSDPDRVLAEGVRVAKHRVIVTESVCHTRLGRTLLAFLDSGFNGLRAQGIMSPALHFKTLPEWRLRFVQHGLTCIHEAWLSRGVHEQRLFVLDAQPVALRKEPVGAWAAAGDRDE